MSQARYPAQVAWAAKTVSFLAVAATMLACATPTDAPPESGGPVVRVSPFEVIGQQTENEFVGLAFAESLALNLGQAEGIEILAVVPVGQPQPTAATVLLGGTLERDDRAVRVALRLQDPAGDRVEWETELGSDSGDLSSLAVRLARRTARRLGVAYAELYEHISEVEPGPAMIESPLFDETLEAMRGSVSDFVRLSGELVNEFETDPAAQALNALALAFAWDAAPSPEGVERLKRRLVDLDRVDPRSPYDELLRAYLYRASGEPEWALELYSRVLARADLSNQARSWALRQRSYVQAQVGNPEAAHDDAREAVDLDPSDASGLFALSRAAEKSERYPEAILHAEQALALEPSAWRYHQRLAISLSRAERHDEAVRSFEHACRISDRQEVCANLAVGLERAGRSAEAREAGEVAIELADSPWGHYNLACFWALAGEREPALSSLERAIELGFADAMIRDDPDLDSIRTEAAFASIVEQVETRIRHRRELSATAFPWQA